MLVTYKICIAEEALDAAPPYSFTEAQREVIPMEITIEIYRLDNFRCIGN